MSLGPPELVIILLIVLVLFGGAKLPKLAKSLGEAQREFKKGTEDTPVSNANSAASANEPPAEPPASTGPIS